MKSINLPLIRSLSNGIAKSICEEICSVQPIHNNVDSILKLVVTAKEPDRKFGDMSHCFGQGFMVFDGTKLIRVDKFINRFGRDKIRFGCFKRHYHNLRPII